MPRKNYTKDAAKLADDPVELAKEAQLATIEAWTLARNIVKGSVKASANTRLTAATKVLDYAQIVLNEFDRMNLECQNCGAKRGTNETSGKGKRNTAPAKNRGAVGTRKPWGGDNIERNPDGTPVSLGGPPVELPDGDRPPE